VTERNGRSFIGLMRKKVGDVTALELIVKAQTDDVTEPIAWLSRAMSARAGPNGKKPAVNASFAGKDYSVGATPDDELFSQFNTH
jgi:hypothetical protein